MALVTTSDFVGKWAISKSFNQDNTTLQTYIDTYENKYMSELLGADLYVLFTAGIAATNPIYEALRDAFNLDIDGSYSKGNRVVISQGVIFMLKCVIYAHYQRQDLGISTSLGHVNADVEGGKPTNDNKTAVFSMYNEGIKTYKAIQCYINENISDYEDFNGIEKGYSWLI